MIESFLSGEELARAGFKNCGTNVQLSRFARIYRPEVISLGDKVRIDDFCLLSGGSGIEIGSCVHISAFCALYGARGVRVGDFCCLSGRTTIYTESDDYSGDSLTGPLVPEKYRAGKEAGPVVVESYSIVGAGSTIMPGITIGTGAAIGAHSFVNQSCDPWSIYAGVPARRIAERSRRLLDLARDFKAES